MPREDAEHDAASDHEQQREPVHDRDRIMGVTVLRVHRTVKQPPHHSEEIGQGQHDPDHRHDDLKRVLAPASDQNHDFGDEVHRARHADRRHAGDQETARDKGHAIDQPAQLRDMARVRLVIDPAGHGEQHPGRQRVREHVQDRPGQTDVVQRRHPEEDIAHVAGAGIADYVLGVLGVEGHEAAVDDVEDAEHGRDRHQLARGLRQDLVTDSDDREVSELHQHAGVQHTGGSRRRGMPHRRPGVQRPDRRDRGKPEEDQQPDDRGQRAREPGLLPQDQNIEGVKARELVDQQDAHQRDHGPHREEQGQLHRGILLAVRREVEDETDRVAFLQSLGVGHVQIPLGVAAPHAQQHIHRDDRHLVEEIQEEHVQRHEDADRGGRQDQQENVEFLRAVLDMPGDEDPGEQEDRRGQHQGGPDAIHPEIERDAELLGPFEPLDELEPASRGIVGEKHVERREHADTGCGRRHQADL